MYKSSMSRYFSNGKDAAFLSVSGEGKSEKDWVATEIKCGSSPDDAKKVEGNLSHFTSLKDILDKYWTGCHSSSEKSSAIGCSGNCKCEGGHKGEGSGEKKCNCNDGTEKKCDGNCGHSCDGNCAKHAEDSKKDDKQVDYFQTRLDEFRKRMDDAREMFDKALSDFEAYKSACDTKKQLPSRTITPRERYESAKSKFFVDVVNKLSYDLEREFDIEFNRDDVDDMSDYTIFLPFKKEYVETFKILPHKGFEFSRKVNSSLCFAVLKERYADVLDCIYVDFWTDFVDDDETSAGLLFTVGAFTEK